MKSSWFRGLFDRRRGKPSPKRVAVVEKVLGLYREKYFDLNVPHFHDAEILTLQPTQLSKDSDYTGAADKAVNLVGCKSPHHQLPGRVVSISDACGGNEACSART